MNKWSYLNIKNSTEKMDNTKVGTATLKTTPTGHDMIIITISKEQIQQIINASTHMEGQYSANFDTKGNYKLVGFLKDSQFENNAKPLQNNYQQQKQFEPMNIDNNDDILGLVKFIL